MGNKQNEVKLDLLDDSNIRSQDFPESDRSISPKSISSNPFLNNTEFVKQPPNPVSENHKLDQPPVEPLPEIQNAQPSRKIPSLKLNLKISRKTILIGAAIAVVLLISIGLIWRGLTSDRPVNITNFETVRSLGQGMQNVPVKTEFEVGDPLAFRFDYSEAEVGTVVSFEIINQQTREVVRDGALKELRDNEASAPDGQRFMSVVSQSKTELPVGNYIIILSVGGAEIARHEFKIM